MTKENNSSALDADKLRLIHCEDVIWIGNLEKPCLLDIVQHT